MSPCCLLSHCHTPFLSFCHYSKYPVSSACSLMVLVYLALGSIRLQAEASHSSQCHKMWLVLTTALQGDGLIGLIASDRQALSRKAAATEYRKNLPASCYVFFFFFFFFTFLHFSFRVFNFCFCKSSLCFTSPSNDPLCICGHFRLSSFSLSFINSY